MAAVLIGWLRNWRCMMQTKSIDAATLCGMTQGMVAAWHVMSGDE